MTNNFSVLENLPGVRSAIVGAADGSLLHVVGGVTVEAEQLAGVVAVFCRQISGVGQVLRLGACSFTVVRSERSAHILILRRGSMAMLEVEPKRLTPELETRLRSCDWTVSPPSLRGGPGIPPPLPSPPKSQQPPQAPPRSGDGVPVKLSSGDTSPMSARDTGAFRVPPIARSPDAPKRAELPRPPQVAASPPLPPPPLLPLLTETTPLPELSKSGRHTVIGNEAMLRGDLSLVSVPDLLEFLRTGQRTGRLICTPEESDKSGSVRMRKGRLIDASSPEAHGASLLTRLLESGDASEEQAKAVVVGDEAESENVIVARRLIDGGFTNPEAVRRTLLSQIQRAIREMIEWTEGSFTFYPGEEESAPCEPVVEADAQVILLQIFKEQDEAGR